MGINLAIVLAHSLDDRDFAAFPERASSSVGMRRAAEQLWQVMSPRWRGLGPLSEFSKVLPARKSWERREHPSYEWAGFSLRFGRAAVAAGHIEELAGFILDFDGLRRPLQMCAQALALELRSPTIAYGPDSSSPFEGVFELVDDGRSLTEILSKLNLTCGIPAATIREMADEHEKTNLDHRCYWVETISEQAPLP